MITYKWEFINLHCTNENGLNDVIKSIDLIIEASEPKVPDFPESGVYSAAIKRTIFLDPVSNSDNFIPFDQLTSEQVQNWVSGKLEAIKIEEVSMMQGIINSLNTRIEIQKKSFASKELLN